ncbi:5320_t:CDS:2, partial [Funneliformis geosporum]
SSSKRQETINLFLTIESLMDTLLEITVTSNRNQKESIIQLYTQIYIDPNWNIWILMKMEDYLLIGDNLNKFLTKIPSESNVIIISSFSASELQEIDLY